MKKYSNVFFLIKKAFTIKGFNHFIKRLFIEECGINNRLPLKYMKKEDSSFLLEVSNTLFKGKTFSDIVYKRVTFLINIGSYRGFRHRLKYPTRGQRTHTNAKTIKKFRY